MVAESGYAPILTARLAPDGSFLGGSIHSFVQKTSSAPTPDPRARAVHLMQRLTAEDFPDSGLCFGRKGEITSTVKGESTVPTMK